jgi:hypothetical protein
MDSELLGIWTLSTVRHSKNYRMQRFGNWICCHPQVRGEKPTLLGPSERANLSILDNGHIPVMLRVTHHHLNPLESTFMDRVTSKDKIKPKICTAQQQHNVCVCVCVCVCAHAPV